MESDDDDTIEYEIEVIESSSSTCSIASESPLANCENEATEIEIETGNCELSEDLASSESSCSNKNEDKTVESGDQVGQSNVEVEQTSTLDQVEVEVSQVDGVDEFVQSDTTTCSQSIEEIEREESQVVEQVQTLELDANEEAKEEADIEPIELTCEQLPLVASDKEESLIIEANDEFNPGTTTGEDDEKCSEFKFAIGSLPDRKQIEEIPLDESSILVEEEKELLLEEDQKEYGPNDLIIDEFEDVKQTIPPTICELPIAKQQVDSNENQTEIFVDDNNEQQESLNVVENSLDKDGLKVEQLLAIALEAIRQPYRIDELFAESGTVDRCQPIEIEAPKRVECISVVVQAQEIVLEVETDDELLLFEKNKRESLEDSPSLELQQNWIEQIPDILKSYAAEVVEEDLESEFDNEPPFEAREVKLKRNRDPRHEYELGDELGKGRFGTVYRCIEQTSGRKLAAKFIHMRRREDKEDVEREVEIMRILQHKRLLQLYDAFDDGNSEMCLITELVEGGELFERVVDDDFELTEKKAAIFMRQICEGVEYMHSQRIVHLDMKPENILCLSKTGNRIKLIDFGLARQLKDDEPLKVMFGTPDFAAPEVLAYDFISLATDMWSVGVICYVLLSGLSPFMGDSDMDTMANVTRAAFDFDDEAFEPISDLAKDFISKLLVRDQPARLKPDACLQHPWLRRGGHELEASVRSRRGSAVVSSGELEMTLTAIPTLFSLDKRNLKKYVVRRKWHKTVHAIMALGRMGANLKVKKLS